MKRKAFLGLAFLLAFTACRGKFEGLGIRLNLEQKRLSNGLNVLMVEDHSVPVVSYQTWFRVGSVDESPGYTGIAHLFEHLMFKGTSKYPAKQFFHQLETKGAQVNAFTTRDYTVYYENFTPNLLEKVIDMESDRMANLVLDETVLDSERLVVFEERRLRTENSPGGRMQEALWELAFRQHPYRHPIIGYPQDLMRLTVEDLQEFFHQNYAPSNATLVIVGDFDPEKIVPLLERSYGQVKARPKPKRSIKAEPDQKEERRLVMYDEVASERFAQAYHVTSADDDDSYALDVLANILFEGSSSRAYQRLVEELDIMGGISGSAFTPTFPGLFLVSGTMKGSLPVEEAEKALDRLIREVQEKEVSKEEIQIAVRQLSVQLVDSVRTPHGLGQLLGTIMTVVGDPSRFSEDLAKYLKVSGSDVKRVANKYLHPNNRSIVTLLPKKLEKKPAVPVKEAS